MIKKEWLLEEEKINILNNKHYEGAMTQGNGFLNIRASYEEGILGEEQNNLYWRMPANVTLEKPRNTITKWGTYIPQVVGKHPILNEQMINLPYFLGINIFYKKEKMDINKSEITEYNRSLNLKTGILTRKLIWKPKNSDISIEIKFERYVSMNLENYVEQNLYIKTDKEIELNIEYFIDGSVTTNGYNHFQKIETHSNLNEIFMSTSTDSRDKIFIKSIICDNDKNKFKNKISENYVSISKKYSIIPSRPLCVTKKNLISLKKNLEKLELKIRDNDKEFHIKKWENIWDEVDIKIEGDEQSQKAIRFSMYHLIRAQDPNRNKVAVCAKGHAGEGYFGHYFWDTEIYLLPFYIYTNPERAKQLMIYRYNTLNGAKKNANKNGYSGAKFPWESSITGEEQCSNWQYSDFEIHINADIVFGIWHYYKNTNDIDFMKKYGFEIMKETSKYWIDRLQYKNGKYHLNGVMGPDEYIHFCNDNYYTNYMVKFALEKTLETSYLLDKKLENKFKNKLEDIIENLYFPVDSKNQIYLQCENFYDYEDLNFEKIRKDKNKHFGNYISQEKNYRSKALKQADTGMLFYLFFDDFSKESIKKNIDYYEHLTTHDSSLSYIIHSIIYAKLGENKKAMDFFKKSLDIDLEKKGASEGVHIANCGGIWQAIVFGFAGINGSLSNKGKIISNPNLPKNWKSLEFKINKNGKKYFIQLSQNDAKVVEL